VARAPPFGCGSAALRDASAKAGAAAPGHARHLLREMLRIRRLEERSAELYTQTKIRGFLQLYIGEEAVAVGAMQSLSPEDAVVATYREHGHALARGIPARAVMAEMYGKVEGTSRGRGGSMHLFDAATRFYGGNAIVGGGLPLAVGLALAMRMQRQSALAACFFGEGAIAEGELHESLNLAALWRLPVLFVTENNLYAMGTALARSESSTALVAKAASYGLPAARVDGMDVLAVEAAAQRAVAAVRAGGVLPRGADLPLPAALDVRSDALPHEGGGRGVEAARPHPGARALARRARLARRRRAGAHGERGRGRARRRGSVRRGRHARARRGPAALRVLRGEGSMSAQATATRTTYREALHDALREALARDERVFLMGEDVGAYGGCYAVSKGLLAEFGPERVRDTPLSESAFVGAGIGAALGGLRPIVELMTVNFSLLAMDQIVNTAALLLHMSGGQFHVPLVIRMATGAGRQLAAQHSHSLEGWYAHVPGLRVLAPATLADARGMLWTALEDPDPVLIFEHVMLYGAEGELALEAGAVDIERAGSAATQHLRPTLFATCGLRDASGGLRQPACGECPRALPTEPRGPLAD
jgi:pyruvate dehydrogenase E1 component beta subunit/2-oxoisovalerate dehydrogenase E1 component